MLRRLSAAEAAVGGLLLALIFVLTLLQAAQRYLPGGGWVWTGELAQFGLVWLTFAMAGHLAARDGHVTLKVVDTVAGPRVLRLVGIFANLTVAVVCLNLAYEAYALVTDGSQQTSPALDMPLGWLYVIPLAGLLLTTVRSVVAVFLPEPETDDGPAVHAPAVHGAAPDAGPAEHEEP
ncbi:TRAP transporter small permease [Streptomyces armeniacus]|uniref:TRAP transporter small permease n=1 Tax=Streptomyces armeniacus TaxID=83291 RepID=A0A345XZT4_9ACTN|nr:TRAP transporter small permease [Streptomyces armeniacus]